MAAVTSAAMPADHEDRQAVHRKAGWQADPLPASDNELKH